jgi:tripartite ATP-independent periplasmic transporter solute receptor, DctP family
MKKALSLLICCALACTVVFAQGGAESTAAKVSKAKFNIDVPADQPKAVGFQQFADTVRTKTDGRVDITIFPSSQLGGEAETAEGMKLNSIQMGSITTSVLASWIPELQILDMPFLFTSDEKADAGIAWLAEYLAADFEKQGFHLIGFSINGARNPMSTFPIRNPEDVSGKKMRVIQSPIHIALWKAVGANPVSIPANEIYTSLQTKVVDYFDNTPTNYFAMKFYEVAPYYTKLNHVYAIAAWVCSNDWWKSLSAADQAVITETAKTTVAYIESELRAQDEIALQKAAEKGSTIITDADLSRWAEKMQPVWAEFAPSIPRSEEMLAQLTK